MAEKFTVIERAYNGGGGVIGYRDNLVDAIALGGKSKSMRNFAYYIIFVESEKSKYSHIAAFCGDEEEYKKNNKGVSFQEKEKWIKEWENEDKKNKIGCYA